jgi:transposase
LGGITKQGNRTIRRLLVLGGAIAVSDCGGATALLGALSKRKGPLRDWYAALLARRPARLASVAMANKLAHIAWAMMATGEAFRTEAFERA